MQSGNEQHEVVVVGGGLAGFCAAVASARHGVKTCLVQDRPVFGGNSSSEIRVTPHGAAAFHAYARETGIISEVLIEERARNHEAIFENGWTNSVWDMTLYDMAVNTPNLTFHVNTSVVAVQKSDDRTVSAVVGRVANAETDITITGDVFIDCTGDGTVAALAGCDWRMGSEARGEFNERHAPDEASKDTMGNSLHFKARNMGYPVPFVAPNWAMHHEDASFFYDNSRLPNDLNGGYWWLEIGVPWDTIHDNETIRHELTRHALGVWDWIKNRDPHLKDAAANYALDWIGQVPGKRESRRILGRYLMTENDPLDHTVFPDEVAYGGWNIDLHSPGGLLLKGAQKFTAEHGGASYVAPYGIPLRVLIARDVDNLMMAGRNVSVTHAALGTVRVMGTGALMGQAVGTAAAIAVNRRLRVPDVPLQAIDELQQALLRDGCFLPNCKNTDPMDLARSATATASSQAELTGVGPSSRGWSGALRFWKDQPQGPATELLCQRCSQWIAIGTDRLDSIAVILSNRSGITQQVDARFYSVTDIWDYRLEPCSPLACTTLSVPPGQLHRVEWKLKLTSASGLKPGSYARLDLMPNPEVEWHVAGALEPGHMAAYELRPGEMRRYTHGVTLSFQVTPPQPCYGPSNVLTGVTRPHRFTNLWRSDPRAPLPQWLELSWPERQIIREIDVTFAGNLLREYHAYPPLYRDPQCVRDYGIETWDGSKWHEEIRIEGNYQRQQRHRLGSALATDKMRIIVYATNGDPSAAIYEVRCYS